uniref:Gag-pol polyprotein n=1 Tax=Solanum tuberosum TaxID=4113 RepID=M0ZQH8_SOLTU
MTISRTNIRRNEEENVDQNVPSQAPIDPLDERVTNEKLRFDFQLMTQARIETVEFYGSKVEEDPKGFIDEVSKVLDFVGVTPVEKAELVSYQLKGAAQVVTMIYKMGNPAHSDDVRASRVQADVLSMIDRAITTTLAPIREDLRGQCEVITAYGLVLDAFTARVEAYVPEEPNLIIPSTSEIPPATPTGDAAVADDDGGFDTIKTDEEELEAND